MFPFAKSTELLFVNKTFFDRFSEATDVTMDCFKTFEGIADAAMKYYEWTNARTPDIPRDHKQFFTADSWLNIAQAGMFQQGAKLFNGENLALDTPEYRRVWETFFAPSVSGGEKFAIQRGNGFMVAKSDTARETAAALFLKWFTSPEQNMRFVAETGYLAVTKEAFETQMPQRIPAVEPPISDNCLKL